jgi:hypothetical protein
VKEVLREMTKNEWLCDRLVIMSSAMPSEKYSWSASPLMLAKGAPRWMAFAEVVAMATGAATVALVGALITSPEANAMGSHRPGDVLDLLFAHVFEEEIKLVAHLVATTRLTQMPPGSARPSRRAAMFTPSP